LYRPPYGERLRAHTRTLMGRFAELKSVETVDASGSHFRVSAGAKIAH